MDSVYYSIKLNRYFKQPNEHYREIILQVSNNEISNENKLIENSGKLK